MLLSEKINSLLENHPYDLNKNDKKNRLIELCGLQVDHHYNNCEQYQEWYKRNKFKLPKEIYDINDFPFIPSSVFKFLNLTSSNNKSKKISSSGTTSQLKSNIYIDTKTSLNQTSALSKILSSHIGKSRIPFFIIDFEPTSNNLGSTEMSARYAGMSGYLLAAKKRNYLLKHDENQNVIVCDNALKELKLISKEQPIVIIGYTYMLWQFINNYNKVNLDIKLHENSKIVHFGGWKKLSSQKVKKEELNHNISSHFSINKDNILDIYGFTEQLGTIYVSQGDQGCRVTDYSHVIVRDTHTFKEVEDGQRGFLQFISCLPESYPGFSILNDDIGYISRREIDESGKEILEFKVEDRLQQAEARGCGDTLPDDYFI